MEFDSFPFTGYVVEALLPAFAAQLANMHRNGMLHAVGVEFPKGVS